MNATDLFKAAMAEARRPDIAAAAFPINDQHMLADVCTLAELFPSDVELIARAQWMVAQHQIAAGVLPPSRKQGLPCWDWSDEAAFHDWLHEHARKYATQEAPA